MLDQPYRPQDGYIFSAVKEHSIYKNILKTSSSHQQWMVSWPWGSPSHSLPRMPTCCSSSWGNWEQKLFLHRPRRADYWCWGWRCRRLQRPGWGRELWVQSSPGEKPHMRKVTGCSSKQSTEEEEEVLIKTGTNTSDGLWKNQYVPSAGL